jgi:SNF2 family DNA or RNA helicase
VARGGCGQKISWKKDVDDWLKDLRTEEYAQLEKAKNSPKLIVLSHILARAFQDQEKVLVYSKCLKTLDLIEHFLVSSDWKKHVGSLKDYFKDMKLGGLKKNKDYVRIDGSVNSGKRGTLVDKFNNEDSDQMKLFLISSLAGGIGIILVSWYTFFFILCRGQSCPLLTSPCNRRFTSALRRWW